MTPMIWGFQNLQMPLWNPLTIQQRALVLAQNPNTPLAVRVTALSIAAEGATAEVKTLGTNLLKNPETPLILRKVAETVVR